MSSTSSKVSSTNSVIMKIKVFTYMVIVDGHNQLILGSRDLLPDKKKCKPPNVTINCSFCASLILDRPDNTSFFYSEFSQNCWTKISFHWNLNQEIHGMVQQQKKKSLLEVHILWMFFGLLHGIFGSNTISIFSIMSNTL